MWGSGPGRAEQARGARLLVHDVHCRWGSKAFWRSWARVIRGRLPAIGRPNAEILHHSPQPAYARTRAAKRPWAGRSRDRGCTPASCVGCAPWRACELRAAAASWQVALGAANDSWGYGF